MSTEKHALLRALGGRIRDLRVSNGWTQTDMAVALDISRNHLSDLETGKREVGLITLQVIARGLNTTMASLLSDL